MLVIGYRYLFISFSSTLVYLFPHNWEQKIGKSTYKTLSKTLLEKSELPEKRIAEIKDKSQKIFKHSELYKNPENIFVSDFIGETNFLKASTKSKDGEHINVTIEDLGDFKVKNNLNIPENSSDVVCSVRPESMMISRDKSDWDICLEAKINQTSYLGEMTRFYVEVSGINKVITVSSQHFDNQSFENNTCFISISLDDISLLQKK